MGAGAREHGLKHEAKAQWEVPAQPRDAFHGGQIRGGNQTPGNADTGGNHWMQKAFSAHPGRLHRALGVPEGEKIPASKMEAASHSKSGHMRKMVALAQRGKEAKH